MRLRYVSTRGAAATLGFEEVLLAGLARDGGLYLPESWPRFDTAALGRLAGLSYRELALAVMTPFLGGAIPRDDAALLIDQAYDSFAHRAVVPLKQLDHGLWLMELFHGPTLAFKDVALQVVGRLFDYVLTRRGRRILGGYRFLGGRRCEQHGENKRDFHGTPENSGALHLRAPLS